MIRKIIVVLYFLFVITLYAGRIGNNFALYVNNVFRSSFITIEGCEAFKDTFYKDRSDAKCVRFR